MKFCGLVLVPKQLWLLWKWIRFITDASWPGQIQASLPCCPSCFSPAQCFSWQGIRIRIHSAPCGQRNALTFVHPHPAWEVKFSSLVLGPKQLWLLWKWIRFISDASCPSQFQASLHGCTSCFNPAQCFSWRRIKIRIYTVPCKQRIALAFVQLDLTWLLKLWSSRRTNAALIAVKFMQIEYWHQLTWSISSFSSLLPFMLQS